jgi:hypothetical protein
MSMNAVPSVAGGGEPPYDKDMDRRLTVLETRFDTILPTLATKYDLEALRSDFRTEHEKLRSDFRTEHEKLRADVSGLLNESMRWIIGLVVAMFIGMLGLNYATFNAIKLVGVRPPPASAEPDPPSRSHAPTLNQR